MVNADTSLARLHCELAETAKALAEALLLGNDVQATETLLLALLARHGTRAPSFLSQQTGLTRGRITHLTSSLEARGWIQREEDPQDRRRSLIRITADGAEPAHLALQRMERLESLVTHELGPAGFGMLRQQLAATRDACAAA